MRNYSPKGLFIWDAWPMATPDGRVHAISIQWRRDRPVAPLELGHAVTDNLYDWDERPPILVTSPDDPDDDWQPWSGCANWIDGKGYLHYTRRGSRTGAREQAVGLAMSDGDPDVWTRRADGPVLVPDPRWYGTARTPVPGILDGRDLVIAKDPDGPGWYGYFAARVPAPTLPETSAIGCAYSRDLIHWEQRAPAYVSTRHACVEFPDVFFMDGRWHMTALTATNYGTRGVFDDPDLTIGTVRMTADRPEGPFVESPDNALLGARACAALSMKTFEWKGRRYFLYTDREKEGHVDHGEWAFGTLSTPKLAGLDAEGLLVAKYDPALDARASAPLPLDWDAVRRAMADPWGQIWKMPTAALAVAGDAVRFASEKVWTVAPLGVRAESFILEATVDCSRCVGAGFAARMEDGERRHGDFLFLDNERGATAFENAWFGHESERRRTRLAGRHHLRVVNRLEHVEVFVDDALRLSFPRYARLGGGLGLFVDRGEAVFENVRVRTLNIERSE